MAGFSDNFRDLKMKSIIPNDIQEGEIPVNSPVWRAINGLTPDQIALLQQISATAQSHMFLIERMGQRGKIVAMGL